MISTILIGGKQFPARLGSRLKVEKLALKKGEMWLGKEILAIQDQEKTVFGSPFIGKAQVKARVIRHGKAKKIIVLKKKRRKGYRKTQGHRQMFTEICIEALSNAEGKWFNLEKKIPKKNLKKAAPKNQKKKV